MRILGFTGTRQIAGHEKALHKYLDRADTTAWFTAFDRYITGGCRGWDGFIGRYLARIYRDTPQTVVVPWNKSQVDAWWEDPEFAPLVDNGMITVVYMEAGTDYRDRNAEIVRGSTELFYCADYPESDGRSKRSGTWMTKRIAEAAHLPINGIILNKEQHEHV